MSLWLDPAMTSPYAFYQFWINADDADIVDLPAHVQLRLAGRDRGAGEGDRRPPGGPGRAAAPGRRADHARARRGRDRAGDRRRPRRCSAGARWPTSPQATLARRARRGRPGTGQRPVAVGRGAAQGVRAGGEHERGPPGHRRGRGLREQRARHRSRGSSPARPPCCTAATWCCGAGRSSSPASTTPPDRPIDRRCDSDPPSATQWSTSVMACVRRGRAPSLPATWRPCVLAQDPHTAEQLRSGSVPTPQLSDSCADHAFGSTSVRSSGYRRRRDRRHGQWI